MRRSLGEGLGDLRRRLLPLPDEVVKDFLATDEKVIHSDHPSFRSFVIQNTVLFLGVLAAAAAFLGIAFNGSLMASALLLVLLAVALLVLVARRLEERYTSYVITDARIMHLKGIVSRRAHAIPWARITDLTIEQNLWGRMFGYATLHIDSANEESGLRNLEGVSDPVRFSKHVVDMVVAKQGTTEPRWAAAGAAPPPQTERGLKRVRSSTRRLRTGGAWPATGAPARPPRPDRGLRRLRSSTRRLRMSARQRSEPVRPGTGAPEGTSLQGQLSRRTTRTVRRAPGSVGPGSANGHAAGTANGAAASANGHGAGTANGSLNGHAAAERITGEQTEPVDYGLSWRDDG
ncbi:MAG TPA: PH domain-containing protein [Acidimicrobiales bacterium]|nr:PH domain-containing protein [Acidimicrobiales bacterium]